MQYTCLCWRTNSDMWYTILLLKSQHKNDYAQALPNCLKANIQCSIYMHNDFSMYMYV